MLWNQAVGRVSAWWSGFFNIDRMGNAVWQRGQTADGLVPGQRDFRRLGRGTEALVFMDLCQAALLPLSTSLASRRGRPPSPTLCPIPIARTRSKVTLH